MDLWEMFEGWRWRYMRELEVNVVMGAVVGNRASQGGDPLDVDRMLGWFPLYERAGADGEDD